MVNNHSMLIDIIIEFFNTILLFNELHSLEAHKKIELRIIAIKRDKKFEIFYIRIFFISDMENIKTQEISKNKKIIATREIFENEKLIEKIEKDDTGIFFKINNIKLYFDNLIKNLKIQDLKENIRIGIQNPYILSDNQFYLFYNDTLYHQSYNKEGGEISKTKFYNEEKDGFIDGVKFFQNFIKVKLGVCMKPAIIVIYPIKSFTLNYKQFEDRFGEKNIEFYLGLNEDLEDYVYMTYRINDSKEKELKPKDFPLMFPISIPQKGNVYIKVYWDGTEELIEKESILYEETFPIYNFLDEIYSEINNVNPNSLNKTNIVQELSRTLSDLEKEDLIGALNHLFFFTDLINLPKSKEWINLELNGYMKFNKYFPQYRKFNAKLFNDDKDINLRCIEIVKDPLGEILTRIEKKI